MNEITKIAMKHGLKLADFFCGYRFYSEEDIAAIKRNAEKKIASGALL